MTQVERKIINNLSEIKNLIIKNATYSTIAEYLHITETELRRSITSLKTKGYEVPKFLSQIKVPSKKAEIQLKNRLARLDKVLKMRYTDKSTYEEIGISLGVTRQRAAQLVKQADKITTAIK